MSVVRAGILFISLAAIAVFFGFTKWNPFSNPFVLKAQFQSAKNLKTGTSEVRIAGIQVGYVKKVEPVGPNTPAALVTMQINKSGLPIHDDAEIKIRPQLFLEGNYFVDLSPGSPSAPDVSYGDTIPITQTAIPVQFGDVLGVFNTDTRKDLRTLLAEYAFKGLNFGGAKGFNGSIDYWEPAYRSSALVNQATLGTQSGDLHRVIGGQQKTLAALADNTDALKGLVTNLNTTAFAFARESNSLQATIPALRNVLTVGPPALRSLDSSLPQVRAFARDALPGVRSSGPTLDALIPFVHQLRALVQPSELRGLVADLRPTVPALARLNRRTVPILDETRQMSACTNNVLIPWQESKIPNPDEPQNNNELVMRQLPRSLVGLAGESRINDSDSPLFRVNFSGGNQGAFFGNTGTSNGGAFAALPQSPSGTRPALPKQQPDHRPDIPCETQDPPNLQGAKGGVSPTKQLTQPDLTLADLAALQGALAASEKDPKKRAKLQSQFDCALAAKGYEKDKGGKLKPLSDAKKKAALAPCREKTPKPAGAKAAPPAPQKKAPPAAKNGGRP